MLKQTTLLTCTLTLIVALGVAAKIAAAGDGGKKPAANLTISLRDFCDPTTFNAPPPAGLGPGACMRDDNPAVNGSQTLAGFRFELGQEKNVGAWRFNPLHATVEEGTQLTLTNRGGEVHTFTRVAKFGGGFVAPLNAASGNPEPAPECAMKLANGQLVPQPPGPNNIFLTHGMTVAGPEVRGEHEVRFQCCIHPWMRTTIKVREDEDESKH
jgi:hypothetical protein